MGKKWSHHRWEEIGHLGDGNEYMVCICKDCGCRATPPDGQMPDDKKYPACTVEDAPAPKPVKKPRKTAWDRVGGKEIL